MKAHWILAVLLLLTRFSSLATAQVPLLQDDFSSSGSLAGSFPDAGASWTTISGTTNLLQVASGRLRVPASGEQSVQSTFAPQSNVTLYAGFTLNCSTLPNVGALAISFRSAEGFVGRIFLNQDPANVAVRIGIDNNLDNPFYLPVSLNLSTDYRIVIGFTENGGNDQTRLWINPASSNDQSVAEITEAVTTAVTGFGFRASGTAGDFDVDDLYVGASFGTAAVPEPSSLYFLGAGFLVVGFVTVRRGRHRASICVPWDRGLSRTTACPVLRSEQPS